MEVLRTRSLGCFKKECGAYRKECLKLRKENKKLTEELKAAMYYSEKECQVNFNGKLLGFYEKVSIFYLQTFCIVANFYYKVFVVYLCNLFNVNFQEKLQNVTLDQKEQVNRVLILLIPMVSA